MEVEIEACPVNNCIVTANRNLIETSSAVIFHYPYIDSKDLPTKRSPDQSYVYFNLEAPVFGQNSFSQPVNSLFNLTYTYRLDSDMVSSMYLWKYAPKIWLPGDVDKDKLWKSKTKFAAAFISHCPTESSREVLIDELKRSMSVDVYGSCGNFKCDRSDHEKCMEVVRTYKFYLAFENSVCKDYVTEKIHFALNNGVIPVVYGGANYSAIFPPNSFIDVMDFAKPEDAAAAILRIGDSSVEYWSYFQWRFDLFWSELPLGRRNNTSWCTLCTMLNKPIQKLKTYDLTRWWYTEGACIKPDIRRVNGAKRWFGPPVKPR